MMLEKLPVPPHGKTGWPWTEESESISPIQNDGRLWPRISIVTPNLNQGNYIEETIRSVLLQNYPNLEYIVIDGGSSDNSVEIIRKYERFITNWISEHDNGQSQAINKGFKKCSGILVNWICSDDMLYKNALSSLAPIIVNNCNALFIGGGVRIDQNSNFINEIGASSIKDLKSLVSIQDHWRNSDSIMQQACLYPLSAIKKIGYLNEYNHLTMDYELWGKLFIADIPVVRCNARIGIFRWYVGQKTSNFNSVTRSLLKTALSLILMQNKFSVYMKITLITNILVYFTIYYYHFLRSVIGLKRRFRKLFYVDSGNLYK